MTNDYTFKICELIKNQNGITFYKLFINDHCQFDEFLDEVNRVQITRKKFSDLISRMGCFGDYMMPQKYLRQIKEVKEKDIYEFKKDDIRIYVKLEKPNVFIILGGFKNSQKKDIQQVKKIRREL
ncbi:MAG: hypothetical protein IJE99_03770 [Alistipes sp.]|nr:hypothetical protein [Alistipes sp.]